MAQHNSGSIMPLLLILQAQKFGRAVEHLRCKANMVAQANVKFGSGNPKILQTHTKRLETSKFIFEALGKSSPSTVVTRDNPIRSPIHNIITH